MGRLCSPRRRHRQAALAGRARDATRSNASRPVKLLRGSRGFFSGGRRIGALPRSVVDVVVEPPHERGELLFDPAHFLINRRKFSSRDAVGLVLARGAQSFDPVEARTVVENRGADPEDRSHDQRPDDENRNLSTPTAISFDRRGLKGRVRTTRLLGRRLWRVGALGLERKVSRGLDPGSSTSDDRPVVLLPFGFSLRLVRSASRLAHYAAALRRNWSSQFL